MPRVGPSGNHSSSVVLLESNKQLIMSMNFLNLPAEIRLQIYEELLVLSEPIGFPSSPPLFLRESAFGLCPALLRASKSVYREASPLLYSRNRFDFSDSDLVYTLL